MKEHLVYLLGDGEYYGDPLHLAKAAKIVRVCVMLHNVCVDRWKLNKPPPYTNRCRRWPDVPEQYLVEDSMPNDESIIL